MDGNTNIPIVDLSREFIENEPDFIEIFKRVEEAECMLEALNWRHLRTSFPSIA